MLAYFKTGTFGRPTLSSAISTRHFLEYARHTHTHISSSLHACMNEHACMNRHANWLLLLQLCNHVCNTHSCD